MNGGGAASSNNWSWGTPQAPAAQAAPAYAPPASPAPAASVPAQAPAAAAPATPATADDEPGETYPEPTPLPSGESPYVTPLVRKLAAEHSVPLEVISGTGVGGRIRKQDVLDAARVQRATEAAAARRGPGRPGPGAAGGARRGAEGLPPGDRPVRAARHHPADVPPPPGHR